MSKRNRCFSARRCVFRCIRVQSTSPGEVSTLSHPTAEGGESSSSTQPFWSTVRSAKVVADDNDPLLLLTLCPSWGPSSLGPLCPRAVLPPYDFCAKTLTVRDARGVNLEGRAETEVCYLRPVCLCPYTRGIARGQLGFVT